MDRRTAASLDRWLTTEPDEPKTTPITATVPTWRLALTRVRGLYDRQADKESWTAQSLMDLICTIANEIGYPDTDEPRITIHLTDDEIEWLKTKGIITS